MVAFFVREKRIELTFSYYVSQYSNNPFTVIENIFENKMIDFLWEKIVHWISGYQFCV